MLSDGPLAPEFFDVLIFSLDGCQFQVSSPPVYELDGSEQQHVSPFVFTLDELYY